ncbi:hypothetical protein CQ056_24045 [Peribacillus simplex]|uniref:conjugal transfer protein TrbL family protein n=1 Tax=Peribacillus TaxID=2675229 RepID=UPI000D001A9C|nr:MULTISPECIES: conjugal transfer protein TrbL family protein [Peribacillus]MCF7625457.1 hypothetical protein [Peribacillus frigoritolerans]PRA78498.1 hypothetical protein CQ056_24045 [Peribacillus simplex]
MILKKKKRNKILLALSMFFLLVFVFNFVTTEVAYAEEEETSESVNLDCGNFDFNCKIREFVLNIVQGAINYSIQQLDTFLLEPAKILEDPTISGFYDQAYKFFFVLLTVIFLYKMVEILATADPESRGVIREKSVKLIFTVCFASSFKWIFEYLLKFNNWFVQGLLEGYNLKFSTFKYDAAKIQEAEINLVFMCILALILAILFFVMLIQMAIRFAELGFALAIAPICIATNLSDNMNLLPGFWKNLLSIIFTQSVQILLILFMCKFFSNGSIWEADKIMFGIGYMILVVKSPQVVKELMYSTGTGRTAGGIGSGTVSTVAKSVIMRRIK